MAKKQKTLAKLKQEAQKVFNAYIRRRDECLPCISCGQTKRLQAGHYFPVGGYDGLRFNVDNVHGECEYCNCWNEAHLIGYGINLKNRIGPDRYNELLKKAEDYKKNGNRFTRSEVQGIIGTYKTKS